MKSVLAVTLWWVLLLVSRLGATRKGSPEEASFYYGTFPLGFSWGVGSSAFQTEGAWDQDGKGPSIWDAFTHSGKGKVLGDETADVACDGYYKVQEDIILLKELHVNHYRFSLSWPRLLPTGVRADQVNEKGIKFYSDLIDALLKSNITPIVTLHHWDLPQAPWRSRPNRDESCVWNSVTQGGRRELLQVKYGGWQNVSMTKYFSDYANMCFEAFGDRVKHWVTFSDPRTMAEKGYETGHHAPGLKLHGTGLYKAAHHIIKAHAQAWHSYNSTWRSKQKGRKSAEQGLDLSRLPVFTLQEKSYIKGTSDFLGLGHFTTRYITERNYPSRQGPSYQNDRDLVELVDPNWPDLGSKWLYSVPWGFRRLLNFAQTQYGDPPIYVMENGASQKLHCTQLCDEWRIQYLKGYINEMLKAIKDGANIKGYTSWSLLDKFEWEKGYSDRYGFYYVEFNNRNKPRYPKASVQYYKKIITANGFPSPREVESWYFQALETCSINNQMLAAEPLLSHMQMATEIMVPTVCTLCVLIAAVLLMLLLRSQN
ncbi:lactase-like protein isoform X3 [Rousettus aegyptiacus]|uniref:lactase-like protein isoform X3 n=1 Tax=Rousettus aegyptiacus TaxID=9407 RepID=UPI00168CCA87|nr:lactase-like protein isoform X3 [Rousettus aegyptiacus]